MRFARWLLTKCIAAERRDAIVGDLEEEYARGRSDAWYWKEALIAIGHEPTNAFTSPALIGLAGAAVQTAIVLLHVTGPLIMLAYPPVVLAAALFARRRYPNAFAPRFWSVAMAWAWMNIPFYFAYVFVITPWGVANVPVLGHLWRIGALLAIGVIAAAASSLRWTGRSITFTVSMGVLGTGALFSMGFLGTASLVATCAAILVAAAFYIYVDRVTGFARRLWIAGASFAMALTGLVSIIALNRPTAVPLVLVRLWPVFGGGLVAAVLIARFTPCARDLQPPAAEGAADA